MSDEMNLRIKALRKEKGLTQAQLAEKIGLTDKAVSKWESGDGKPDIGVLTDLANLFGVTIDYLLTGKTPEPQFIPISKMELCCKNDDVKMFVELPNGSLEARDENEKTLFDYIDKYNSENVFNEFLKTYRPSNLVSGRYGNIFDVKIIYKLLIKYNKLDILTDLNFFDEPSKNNSSSRYYETTSEKLTIFDDKLIEYFMETVNYPSELFNIVFTMHSSNMVNNEKSSWQALYSKVIEYSIKYDRDEITKYLIELIRNINKTNLCEYRKKLRDNSNSNRGFGYSSPQLHASIVKDKIESRYRSYDSQYAYAIVSLSAGSIKALLDAGYIEEAEEFNDVKVLLGDSLENDNIIDLAKLKKQEKVSDSDIFIRSCVSNHILDIKKLLACNNYRTIRNALNNYPINRKEFLENQFDKRNFKTILEYAIDNNLDYLKDYILNCKYLNDKNFDEIIREVTNQNDYRHRDDSNSEYFSEYSNSDSNDYKEVKKALLYKVMKELPHDDSDSDLRKQFMNQLDDNNIDMLIINLYKQVEKIFNCFSITGDTYKDKLDILLKEHFTDFIFYRDILVRLSVKRNSIVHAEPSEEYIDFTMDELKDLISFICSMYEEAKHE